MILLATVTSLPELVTGVSAVTMAGAPDIAVGDALGSCVFNLAILPATSKVPTNERRQSIAGASASPINGSQTPAPITAGAARAADSPTPAVRILPLWRRFSVRRRRRVPASS